MGEFWHIIVSWLWKTNTEWPNSIEWYIPSDKKTNLIFLRGTRIWFEIKNSFKRLEEIPNRIWQNWPIKDWNRFLGNHHELNKYFNEKNFVAASFARWYSWTAQCRFGLKRYSFLKNFNSCSTIKRDSDYFQASFFLVSMYVKSIFSHNCLTIGILINCVYIKTFHFCVSCRCKTSM